MKILQKPTKIIHRFRCYHCRSLYEMDEEERKQVGAKSGYKGSFDFYCPVCKCDSFAHHSEYKKIRVMDDGSEIE